MMPFRRVASAALVLALAAPVAGQAIRLDGEFEDWADVPVALTDPVDAPGAELDLGTVQVASDASFLHLLIEIRKPVNPQRLRGRLTLVLDADGDPTTGAERFGLPGADLLIHATPPDYRDASKAGQGYGVDTTRPVPDPAVVNPYTIGLAIAPTYAAPRFEMRLERGAEVPGTGIVLAGREISGKLVLTDVRERVLDETATFMHTFADTAADLEPRATAESLNPRGDLRVVNWNGERGVLLQRPLETVRLVRALRPDVILFQEFEDTTRANSVAGLLRAATGEQWLTYVGRDGGNLRCVVASRVPVRSAPTADPVLLPGGTRAVRVASTLLTTGDRRIVLSSLHLKCCGSIGSSEDERRLEETAAIREAVLRTIEQDDADGVILAGDLNLVGGRAPLDRLIEGLDPAGGDLVVANPFQLDGRTNTTWEKDSGYETGFVPGRLDFQMHSPSTLEIVHAFVLDTRDLTAEALEQLGLQAGDSAISDHLPVVVDYRFRGSGG